MNKVDLHVHSSCSDGSDTPKELAQKIIKEGINIVALTDHDTVCGIDEFEKNLNSDIKFIKGIELTCLTENIKCHILGYYINPKNKGLQDLIEKGKILRKQKLETRIKYLKDIWNIELTEKERNWLYSRKSVVKTHLANILVNRDLADNNIDAMKKYLDGCKTGNTRFDGKEAIQVIKSSGGIPVWAHPLGGEGEKHINEEIFQEKLKTMISNGIQGLECYYSRYNEKETDILIKAAGANNLYISGGSDYHGTNKDVPLGKLTAGNGIIHSTYLSILEIL